MALEGSLKDFGLADILQLIYFQRKTGVLSLDGNMDKVRLLFIDGNIVGAESKRRNEDNRLGKILVKKGFIKESDLTAVLDDQRKSGAKIGTVLIQKGLVDKDKIWEILNNQVTETVVQLFGWKQGTYEFAAQGVPHDKELAFSLDTQHLLMDGLRIVDELSVIRDRLTLDTLFLKKSDTATGLTAEENEVFQCVDGESDVSTIVDLIGRDNFEVSKTLISLVDKGLIEARDAAPVVAAEAVLPAKEKTVAFLRYLPYLVIAASLVLSMTVMALQRDDTLKVFSTAKTIEELRFTIEAHKLQQKAYPETLPDMKDPWGESYRYRVSGDSFTVRSSGPDRTEGTKDDIF